MIELLVVIAITAVLISLIFLGTKTAMTTTNRAKSANNLRSIGMAYLAYAGDNNYRLPAWHIRTISYSVRDGAPLRQLFKRTEGAAPGSTEAFGQGDTEYLSSVDVLYSPFSPEWNKGRVKGHILYPPGSGGIPYIGYLFYSSPQGNELNPGHDPPYITDNILTGNPKTVLMTDPCTSATVKLADFTDDRFHVLYLSGNVRVFELSETLSFGSNWVKVLNKLSE